MHESSVVARLSRRDMVSVGAWALAYFVAHVLAFYIPDARQIIMVVWPAAGIGLAALLLSPRAWWPWLLSAFVVVGVGADVAIAHRPFAASVGYMAANVAEAIGCALLITRVSGRDVRFDRVAEVAALLVSALGINAITACIGAGAALLAPHGAFSDAWWVWYVADGLGILLVTPLIIAWRHAREADVPARAACLAESVLFFGVLSAVTWLALNPPNGSGMRPYLVIALLAWPAFRLRRPVLPTALALLALIAIGDAVFHSRSNALTGSTVEETLRNTQIFLGAATTVGLLLAASYAETRAAAQVALAGEARYRALFDQAGDHILLLELMPDGPPVIRDANDAALLALGYTHAELIGAPVSILEPDLTADVNRQREQSAARLGSGIFEVQQRCKDGSVIEVEVRAAEFTMQGRRMVITSERDSTERKAAAEALRAVTNRMTLATAAGRVAIWEYDVVHGTLVWDDAMFALYGIRQDQFSGAYEAWQAGLHPDDRVRGDDEIQRAVRGEQDFDTEFRVVWPDRSIHHVRALAQVQRDDTGRAIRMIGTNWDITDRKQAEAERAALQSELQQAQKMETVGRLAGGVAHDYNNMLAVILGNADMALRSSNVPPALRADLEEIQRAATHSAEITQQLLTFARKQRIRPRQLDLNATVSSALQLLRPLIGEQVRFTWHPVVDPWPVTLDATQVQQILTNLCLNARDAITGVGTLAISTANRVIDATQCETHIDAVAGDYVQLTVTDSGRGMSDAVLSHIFEPFYTTKGVGEGSGLGLASVYGAVRQNGGFIAVSSAEGKGTTFDIYFPREMGPLAAPAGSPPVAPLLRGHETILVVEDEDAVRRMTVRALEAQGYTVFAADGPSAALRLVQDRGGDVAVVLTDVQLPEMSGPELVETLRKDFPHVKHLFMSAHPFGGGEGDAAREDAAHFLAKPFTLEALTTKVHEVLHRA